MPEVVQSEEFKLQRAEKEIENIHVILRWLIQII